MTDLLDGVAAIPLIAAGSAAAALVSFVAVFVMQRRAEAGLAVLAAVFIVTALLGPAGLAVGGVRIVPYDLLCVLFVVATVIRLSRQRPSLAHIAWIGLGGVTFLSVMLGIGAFGLEAAGNEARISGVFYFWACAAYFSSFDLTAEPEGARQRIGMTSGAAGPRAAAGPEGEASVATTAPTDASRPPPAAREAQRYEPAERWLSMLGWAGAVLSALVAVRWGLELAGIEVVPREREVGAAPFRVVPSDEAMLLASLALVLLRRALSYPAGSAPRWLWPALAVLFVEVLLLQHRSVWLGTAAGLAVLTVLKWSSIRRMVPYVAGTVVLAGLAVGALLTGGALDGAISSLSYSMQNEATMEWRIEGWADLIAQWRNAADGEKLFGAPFGAGFRRYMVSLGIDIERSPHNAYVTLLLRVGVLGLALFALTYAVCVRHLAAARRRYGGEHADCLLAALAAQAVYFVFYDLHIMQAVFLGAAIGLCRAPEPRAAAQVSAGQARAGRPWA